MDYFNLIKAPLKEIKNQKEKIKLFQDQDSNYLYVWKNRQDIADERAYLLLQALKSPFLPEVYGQYQNGVLLSYIPGKNLSAAMKELKQPQERLRLIESLIFILQQLNIQAQDLFAAGFAHLDIKPQNIILRLPAKIFCLIDFSSAIILDQSRNFVTGTKSYMAPEVFKGQVNETTDLYSLIKVIDFMWSEKFSKTIKTSYKSDIAQLKKEIIKTRKSNHKNSYIHLLKFIQKIRKRWEDKNKELYAKE